MKAKTVWMDDYHGRVVGGLYDGFLLRRYASTPRPYTIIDVLTPGSGWKTLASEPKEFDETTGVIDQWLNL